MEEKKAWLTNGIDIFDYPPPKTENEVGKDGWSRESRG